jgi:hypothetical protein
VTVCPASALEMLSPAAICGNSPAGKVSVMMQIKPVIASASRADIGSDSVAASSPVSASSFSIIPSEIIYVSIGIYLAVQYRLDEVKESDLN